jgi:O-antigen/teichoic acid export membrane protein
MPPSASDAQEKGQEARNAADPSEPDPTMSRARASGRRLARRLLSNYALQIVNLGIRLFDQLLFVPLYLAAWGTDLYRDWLVVTAITSFLGTCSFGIDGYFANRFIHAVSTGDAAALRHHMRVALFVSSAISLVLLALLYATLLLVNVSGLLGLSAMGEHNAVLVFVILTLPMWGWFSVMTLHDIYRAYGDFTRGEFIFALYAAAQFLSMLTALALHEPPTVAALCSGLMPIACAVATVIDVTRRYPAVSLGFAVPSREEWRQMVPQSLLYFSGNVSPTVLQNAPMVLFALYDFSAATIVMFNVCRVFTGLTRQIGAQSFAVGSGIEMARQYVLKEYEGCRRLYADTGRIVACIAGVLSGISLPLATPFIRLWTHGSVTADTALVLCFLIGIYFSAPGRASLMLLRYTNHPRAIGWANSLYSLGGILLAMALAWPLGALGVALGFAAMEALGLGFYPPFAVERRFRFSAMRHLLNSFSAGSLAFLLSFAVAYALFDGTHLGLSDGTHLGLMQIVLRVGVWGMLLGPIVVILALSQTHRVRLFAQLGRRFWRRGPERSPIR